MFSSFLVEALLAGRHVVSFQPNAAGKDMNAWGREQGIVPRATNVAALLAALKAPNGAADSLRDMLERSCERLENALLGVPVKIYP
jgi:hypothetical protein